MDERESFFMGCIIGVVLVVFVDHFFDGARSLKIECEANIPRNQQCIMQYVPEIKFKELNGE